MPGRRSLQGLFQVFTTILAYLLIALFSVGEGRLRKGQAAQTFEAGASDRNSTRRLGAAYGLAVISLLLAPLLNYLALGHIPYAPAGWVGLAVACGGIALRIWANQILGEFYTRTLRVIENQPIVQHGPYRLVRHPGYLGVILMWVGAGLATTNWIVSLLALGAMAIVYHYRIQAEEAMLLDRLGQSYANYQAHTWKLMPFVY
jgi:protein-S-isoprenylcysteine O-methyltransferase Ste14